MYMGEMKLACCTRIGNKFFGEKGVSFIWQVASHVVTKANSFRQLEKGAVLERIRHTFPVSSRSNVERGVAGREDQQPYHKPGTRWNTLAGLDLTWASTVDDS